MAPTFEQCQVDHLIPVTPGRRAARKAQVNLRIWQTRVPAYSILARNAIRRLQLVLSIQLPASIPPRSSSVSIIAYASWEEKSAAPTHHKYLLVAPERRACSSNNHLAWPGFRCASPPTPPRGRARQCRLGASLYLHADARQPGRCAIFLHAPCPSRLPLQARSLRPRTALTSHYGDLPSDTSALSGPWTEQHANTGKTSIAASSVR